MDVVPIPTYFSIGKHALPGSVQHKITESAGEVTDNLVFLGQFGVFEGTDYGVDKLIYRPSWSPYYRPGTQGWKCRRGLESGGLRSWIINSELTLQICNGHS